MFFCSFQIISIHGHIHYFQSKLVVRDGLKELPSVHSWIGKGFGLAADSFIQTQQKETSFYYRECVNDAGDKFHPLLVCAWTEGSSLLPFSLHFLIGFVCCCISSYAPSKAALLQLYIYIHACLVHAFSKYLEFNNFFFFFMLNFYNFLLQLATSYNYQCADML